MRKLKLNTTFLGIVLVCGMLTSMSHNYAKASKNKYRSILTTQLGFNPQNTVIVFDIHDVITEIAPQKIWPAFWELSHKGAFLGKAFKYFFKNKKKQRSIEELMLTNQIDRDNKATIALINPHIPIPETTAILRKLKNTDYQIYGCSNIGQASFEFMQQQYPTTFKLMTACRTSNKANRYMKKTNPLAYQETIKMIETHFPQVQHIVFVDNKIENLKLATQVDQRFYGILFKNPKQLRMDLIRLGIL